MPKRGGQRFSGIPSLAMLLYFLVLKNPRKQLSWALSSHHARLALFHTRESRACSFYLHARTNPFEPTATLYSAPNFVQNFHVRPIYVA